MFDYLAVLTVCVTVIFLVRKLPAISLRLPDLVVRIDLSDRQGSVRAPERLVPAMPQDVKLFIAQESESWLREQMTDEANSLYLELGEWPKVASTLRDRYATIPLTPAPEHSNYATG